jgi:hypothetical protein
MCEQAPEAAASGDAWPALLLLLPLLLVLALMP